ncbi:hypothetical protein [Escherichia phage PJNS034]
MEAGVDLTPVKNVGLVKASTSHNGGVNLSEKERYRRRELSGGIAEHHCTHPGYQIFPS